MLFDCPLIAEIFKMSNGIYMNLQDDFFNREGKGNGD